MKGDRLGSRHEMMDALRVRTLGGPQYGGASSVLMSMAAQLNQIALYRASGDPLEFYTPDAAGLVAALATAVAGDTVWLPSQPIALTAGVTLPGAIALIGIDEYASLSFSGFSGTAITMAANAMVSGFTLVFEATGTTAIGVDARFAGAVCDLPVVVVSGGSATNVGVWAGSPDV